VHAAACTKADLDPRPIYESDGAMGSTIHTFVVQNRSHAACRLDSPVRLLYTDHSGAVHTVPTSPGDTTPPAPYVVPARRGPRRTSCRPAGTRISPSVP